MRVASIFAVTALVLITGSAIAHTKSEGKASRTVEIAGSIWRSSFEDAKLLAQEQGKPILHLQMFGELDDEFC